MKKLFVVLAAILFSLIFSLAYGYDETNKDIGTVLFESRPEWMIDVPVAAEAEPKDVGVSLYESHLALERGLAEPKGMAAGGIEVTVDETTLIWDRLLG